MRRSATLRWCLSLAPLFVGPPLLAMDATEELVNRMESVYARIHDISADFTQVAQSESLGRRLAEKGTLALMRPGLMRWEYHAPEKKLFVARGETTFFWVPADNQVIEAPRQALREVSPSGLLLDGAPGFRERYEITRDPDDGTGGDRAAGEVTLRFRPLTPSGFEYALVSVDPKDAIARRIVIVDGEGNRTEYHFDNLRIDAGLSPSLFDWTPPEGVERIRREAP